MQRTRAVSAGTTARGCAADAPRTQQVVARHHERLGQCRQWLPKSRSVSCTHMTNLITDFSATLTATVKSFAERWRSDFADLHKTMLAYFSNFALGAAILRQTLTLAVHSYRVFLELLRTRYASLYDELQTGFVPLDDLNTEVDRLCEDIV